MADAAWAALQAQIAACAACPLGAGAKHKVPGQGDPASPLLLLGEGPGQREDEEGLAFVGPAGQLLTRLLAGIGLPRDRVYICNVVKCRPPNNRVPAPEEAAACAPLLAEQLRLVAPQVIVLLGATAARQVLGEGVRITRIRGQWFALDGRLILPTYHPSALLRDPGKLAEAEADFASLRARLYALRLYPDLTAYRHDETGG